MSAYATSTPDDSITSRISARRPLATPLDSIPACRARDNAVAVVPWLRCIIEDRGLIGFARCRGDDLLQRQVRKLRSCYQLVQVIDISLVMLAVVEADGVC